MIGWTLQQWQAAYRSGEITPVQAMKQLATHLHDSERALWIHLLDEASLVKQAEVLTDLSLPLYGIPFAVKDNIDVAGLPTTAACPDFAYIAEADAGAVRLLREAGAIVVGKTNLDQFATGLVGTRSPYGEVPNPFNSDYISGGSSSGSAAAVSLGLVPFALGTDTAGSGRVPAAFTNTVGLKPTRGAISTRGVVPACRTLDCVSIFALNVDDARTLYQRLGQFDPTDAFSRPAPDRLATSLPARPRLGIPKDLPWFGDSQAKALWEKQLTQLADLAELVELDTMVLQDTAALLYQGPWVAERFTVTESLLKETPNACLPVIRDILEPAATLSAADTFRAQYQLAELKRQADALMASVDALVVPTAPGIHTRAAVSDDPITLNSQLGTWTNFVNLLDLCALALPGGFRDDGLPGGFTLIAPAWQDLALTEFAGRWQQQQPWTAGATGQPLAPPAPVARILDDDDTITVAVVGAHLSGMPLNSQLTERHAVLLEATRTAPCYRLYALANTTPPKPGLIRDDAAGDSILIELWQMPMANFGSFVSLIPAPLGIGSLETEDGRWVKGFICEPWAIASATEVTALGGWRAYIAQRNNAS
ncbi:allophanate hydrolase [Alcanivorax hongdengensis A-11-3]|uniref:Allophanate hydrolase n=1 Tax=Alcanivorax hongdengensis A-11-3 TaxID=1177179 RepID=L0WH42_9GAMM|nr:allophanate hydrolase [Alcanivorax hongdengensis]EKF76034.1 allophanate hydrolase [Alcanivorax hongdengensis A-11-3]